MDQQQLYADLYKEYRNEMRHQETQRAAVSGACVALAGAIIGLALQDKSSYARTYLGLVLINFSLVSIFVLRKLYERFTLARERAMLYLEAIDLCPQRITGPTGSLVAATHKRPDLMYIWRKGRQRNEGEGEYASFSFVRLHKLWESLLIGAIAIGAILALYGSVHPFYLQRKLALQPHLGWLSAQRSSWLKALLMLLSVVSGPLAQITILRCVRKKDEREEREKDGDEESNHLNAYG